MRKLEVKVECKGIYTGTINVPEELTNLSIQTLIAGYWIC